MASYTIHHYPSLAQDTIAREGVGSSDSSNSVGYFCGWKVGGGYRVCCYNAWRNPRTRVGRWLNKIWKGRRGAAVKSEFFHRFELRPFIRDRFMISGDGYTREYLVARRGICSF